MSKRFKGKTCVYCAMEGASEAGDHVFAREFFSPSQRSGIPQVPACRKCNQAKSVVEHYLTALLPFGGRHADAASNLATLVPNRLANNEKLRHELARGSSRMWTKEKSGLYVKATALPIDGERLEKWIAFVVRGLMWHHWQVMLGDECFVEVHNMTAIVEKVFTEFSAMNATRRVPETPIGDGAFVYSGAQGVDNPQISVWELSIYGGLKLMGQHANDECTKLGAFTGPKRIQDSAERNMRAGSIIPC
jgi:hypothetical protein